MSVEDLIRLCAEGTGADAWEEFVSRFHRVISLSAIRVARQWGEVSHQLLDDLVQEAYLKLCAGKCRLLQDFALRHPEAIAGYIKTVAANAAHDYFKSARSLKRGAGKVQDSVDDVDPSAGRKSRGSPEAMERAILLKEINQCLDSCSVGPEGERDCLMFWLYYRQGISARAIAALPGVGLSAKGVESAILRMTRLIRQQLVEIRAAGRRGQQPGQKGFRPAQSY